MYRYLTLILICLCSLPVHSQSRKERKLLYESSTNYEVEMLGVGQDGTKVFKIWAYGKTPEDAIMQAKRQAVRACLFRGLPGSKQTNATPAICPANAESIHTEFFNSFFNVGGSFLGYVNITTDGMPSGQDRLKIKKGYKVGVKVQILYDNLRKAMENEGIAQRLNQLF